MNVGRFTLCVIAAYIVYAALYIGIMMGVFGELFMANADMMRPPEDSLMAWGYLAHLVQTIAVVWLFDKAVGSNDMKAGAIFGFWVGLYLAATDSTFYTGVKMSTDPWLVAMITHLFVGVVVGIVLSFLYKAPAPAEAEAAA
ncbi:MAG: hypothetical protein EP335_13150 [Alphaproteobacteria bacterium]|nr:MAG: hypothetical protein EP335_13150 [Alphaproteobacteria bacterium]